MESEVKIFAEDLEYHEHRVIKKGDIFLSMWLDGGLLLCASNMYKLLNEGGRSGFIVGGNVNPIPPLLSRDDCEKLSELSQSGLANMAKKLGYSGSKRPVL